jgi:cytochrome c-type biogenesis protein CcmE
LIGSAMAVLAIAVALMLNALRDSIFFNSRSVEKHCLRERAFEVTDGKNGILVNQGALPDLFREGQGVVAEGALDAGGTFQGGFDTRQARRNLYAQGGRRRFEALGTLEG